MTGCVVAVGVAGGCDGRQALAMAATTTSETDASAEAAASGSRRPTSRTTRLVTTAEMRELKRSPPRCQVLASWVSHIFPAEQDGDPREPLNSLDWRAGGNRLLKETAVSFFARREPAAREAQSGPPPTRP